MTESALPVRAWLDYYELTKPRVIFLMLGCAFVGMLMAHPGINDIGKIVFALLGIALVASSAAVVNHVADARLDVKMVRTNDRPVATGRVSTKQGLVFSAVLGISGVLVLFFLVNPLSAWLNFLSWVGYATFYTLYLKHATSQNIVIGGLFGAAPPLLGWAAITNSVELGALVMVLIIFVWTPPHFWALALDRVEDYREAGVPMLPITHGDVHTRRQILIYTVALIASSVLPYFIGMNGLMYLSTALVLGGMFLFLALRLRRPDLKDAPMKLFRFSTWYLGLLFAMMVTDSFAGNWIA